MKTITKYFYMVHNLSLQNKSKFCLNKLKHDILFYFYYIF